MYIVNVIVLGLLNVACITYSRAWTYQCNSCYK